MTTCPQKEQDKHTKNEDWPLFLRHLLRRHFVRISSGVENKLSRFNKLPFRQKEKSLIKMFIHFRTRDDTFYCITFFLWHSTGDLSLLEVYFSSLPKGREEREREWARITFTLIFQHAPAPTSSDGNRTGMSLSGHSKRRLCTLGHGGPPFESTYQLQAGTIQGFCYGPVSYTHLTLPTILLV